MCYTERVGGGGGGAVRISPGGNKLNSNCSRQMETESFHRMVEKIPMEVEKVVSFYLHLVQRFNS